MVALQSPLFGCFCATVRINALPFGFCIWKYCKRREPNPWQVSKITALYNCDFFPSSFIEAGDFDTMTLGRDQTCLVFFHEKSIHTRLLNYFDFVGVGVGGGDMNLIYGCSCTDRKRSVCASSSFSVLACSMTEVRGAKWGPSPTLFFESLKPSYDNMTKPQ